MERKTSPMTVNNYTYYYHSPTVSQASSTINVAERRRANWLSSPATYLAVGAWLFPNPLGYGEARYDAYVEVAEIPLPESDSKKFRELIEELRGADIKGLPLAEEENVRKGGPEEAGRAWLDQNGMEQWPQMPPISEPFSQGAIPDIENPPRAYIWPLGGAS